MNVRLHTLRAVLCAGLILVPHSLLAQTKLTTTTTTTTDTAAPVPVKETLVDVVDSKRPLPPFFRHVARAVGGGLAQYVYSKMSARSYSLTRGPKTSAAKNSSTSYSTAQTQQVSSPMMPIDEIGVPQEVTVTILARQITCNGGPQVLAKLSYQIGNNPAVALFNGGTVEEGMTTTFVVPAGTSEPVKFITTFLATGGCSQKVVVSNDPRRSLTIVRGTDLLNLILQKGINLVWDGQFSLLHYLVPNYVDPESGIAIMDDYTSIFTSESMTTGLAFDHNDLIFKVYAPGPQYADQWVREAVGDPQSTEGMLGVPMHSFMPNLTPFFVPAVELAVDQPGYLSQVRIIGYDTGSIIHPDQWSFSVLLWSDPSIPINSPSMRRTGDLGNITLLNPVRTQWGVGPGGRVTYEYLLDVSGMQAWLEPGHTYALGVTMNSYPGSDGVFTLSTSNIQYAGDRIFTPSGVFPVSGGSSTAAISVSQSVPVNPQQGEKSGSMMQQQMSSPSGSEKPSDD